MTYTLIVLGVVAAAVLAGFILSAGKKPKEPVFVCDRCNENHCDCHLDDGKAPRP